MRIRLLLDVELNQDQVADLQTIIDKQPDAYVSVNGSPPIGARLMGAQPVEGER